MFGRSAYAGWLFHGQPPIESLDKLEPCVPGRQSPPILHAPPLAPRAAENPASNCKRFRRKSRSERASSVGAWRSSASPRPPADLPEVDIRPTADRTPV